VSYTKWASGPFFYYWTMQKQNQVLVDSFESEISALGFELVGVEMLSNGNTTTLRVYIDKDAGITIDDCVLVSQQLTGLLDVEDPIQGHYDLEVSSPGLDRPIFTLAQFECFVGQNVNCRLYAKLDGRRRFKGKLVKVENEHIFMSIDKGDYEIPFDMIERAKLVPDF